MKFKLNRGKSIKLGDKEIPISTTDGWTDIPDDEIINTLSNAVVKSDCNQHDINAPDYIKNSYCCDRRYEVDTGIFSTNGAPPVSTENGLLTYRIPIENQIITPAELRANETLYGLNVTINDKTWDIPIADICHERLL